jgi:exodeoxyribonuclease VII large subunit
MSDAPRLNLVEVSVSELSAALKRTLEDAHGYVRVRGELGKVSYHSNGHIYFDLKDDRACIAGVVWRSAATRIKLKLEAGLEVVATGRVTTYPSRSQYQIVVETLEPAGIGALMALVEERKRKLAAEGLFDEARKQLLPFLPLVIGVITSPTGAVIRDILHRLADRFPRHVLLWPVRVQGEGSASEVAAAILGFNALPSRGSIPRPDLLIVARGGGSLEDLWSFNEEIVVRAAAESMIPLISAVGHETDITLIDFAADRRAPTPTAAAEMAVPVRAELLLRVDSLTRRSLACWQRGHETRRTDLRAATRALSTAEELLAIPRQRLDVAAERLPRALRSNAHAHERLYARWAARLRPETLRMRVGIEKTRLGTAADRLVVAVRTHIETHRTQIARRRERTEVLFARAQRAINMLVHRGADVLDRLDQLLDAFSYRGVLERGFALVRDLDGKPLHSAAAIRPGLRIDVEFSDGRVRALSEGLTAGPARKPSRGRRGGGGEGQGSLFGS